MWEMQVDKNPVQVSNHKAYCYTNSNLVSNLVSWVGNLVSILVSNLVSLVG